MSAVHAHPPGVSTPEVAGARRVRSVVPGLVVALVVAGVATACGRAVPVVGAAVFAIVGGLLASLATGRRPGLLPGYRFSARTLLKASIVLLGAGLSLAQVGEVGWSALPVLVPTLVIALVGSVLVGRALGVRSEVGTLVGVGTAICGATAIAAAAAATDADEEDVAPAIWTIFTFNVLAVLTFPAIGHLLDLSQPAFGLWAGAAINDTSSVAAAAFAYGDAAGADALVVKLTRSMAIVPVCIGLVMVRARSARADALDGDGTALIIPWRRAVPGFLIGFLLAVALNSVGLIPDAWSQPLDHGARFAITWALAGVGLSVDPAALRRTGWRPVALGAVLSLVVAGAALAQVVIRAE